MGLIEKIIVLKNNSHIENIDGEKISAGLIGISSDPGNAITTGQDSFIKCDISVKLDKSQNFADIPNKEAARTNIDVYSKAEVIDHLPIINLCDGSGRLAGGQYAHTTRYDIPKSITEGVAPAQIEGWLFAGGTSVWLKKEYDCAPWGGANTCDPKLVNLFNQMTGGGSGARYHPTLFGIELTQNSAPATTVPNIVVGGVRYYRTITMRAFTNAATMGHWVDPISDVAVAAGSFVKGVELMEDTVYPAGSAPFYVCLAAKSRTGIIRGYPIFLAAGTSCVVANIVVFAGLNPEYVPTSMVACAGESLNEYLNQVPKNTTVSVVGTTTAGTWTPNSASTTIVCGEKIGNKYEGELHIQGSLVGAVGDIEITGFPPSIRNEPYQTVDFDVISGIDTTINSISGFMTTAGNMRLYKTARNGTSPPLKVTNADILAGRTFYIRTRIEYNCI